MKLLNFLIVKITLCLLLGIVVGFAVCLQWQTSLLILAVSVLLWAGVFCMQHTKVVQLPFLGILTYMVFTVLGIVTVALHTEKNHRSHYINHVSDQGIPLVKVQVYEQLKSTGFHNRFLAKVIAVDTLKTSGKLLLATDTLMTVAIDDVFYVSGELLKFKPPKNPYQFDYARYMENQQVYRQVYITPQNTIQLVSATTIYGKAATIRNRINQTLLKHHISEENLSIINALLLGQRQEVTKATYKSFINSGAVHILAISGLHIGLLLLLLRFCFKPIMYLRYGKIIVPTLIVFLLWTYAFITGLSPSVVRAVTMFSLFTIAMYVNRPTNSYNVLTISAFILLLCNPYYVFAVGFQLSYLAVFAILWIKPMFDKLWRPKYFVFRKLWDVLSVSLAAQLGVLPLALYYFHQFPGLFFITNIVIIPLLGILLGAGIVCLVFAYLGCIPKVLFEFFDYSISLLLQFVQLISSKEAFVLTNISFNSVCLVSCYLLIVSVLLLWEKRTYNRLVFALVGVLSVQLVVLFNTWKYNSKEAFVVFNQYNATLLGVKKGKEFYFAAKGVYSKQNINRYVINEFIETIYQDSLKNCYQFDHKRILVIDENAVYVEGFDPDLVFLTASPKINLERLIRDIQPKQVIATTNNYKSYVSRWEATCAVYSVAFYGMDKEGAYVLEK